MTTYANPGPIADVVATSGRVESTWGNAMRDRIVNSFASTASRDTFYASVNGGVIKEGQFCYVAYTGAGTGLLQYCGAVDGWRQPWNSDWGSVGADGTTTSTQSGITTIADLTSLTITFTAVANRRYKVTGNLYLSSNIAGDQMTLTLADGAGTAKQTWLASAPGINYLVPMTPVFVVLGLAAGATTLKFRLTRSSGSGSLASSAGAAFVASIGVSDDGPNGNPS